LPALRSFCLFCGFGILAVFFFQITWFLAWMAIDEGRKKDSSSAARTSVLKRTFKGFGQLLTYNWMTKGLALLVTLIFSVIGALGVLQLRQHFDPIWFLPKDSYLFHFASATKQWGKEKKCHRYTFFYY